MIAVLDYGVGNIFSLSASLKYIGKEACLTRDKDVIRRADRVILPGVGAFADAKRKLFESGMDKALIEAVKSGKPTLGICLGMQLMFDKSFEYGEHEGLSLIGGSIVPVKDVSGEDVKIPHMGWNKLHFTKKNELFSLCNEGEYVYFVHSYCASDCDDFVTATTDYGAPLTAAAANKNVYAVQFHPEKSGETGLNILRAFCRI